VNGASNCRRGPGRPHLHRHGLAGGSTIKEIADEIWRKEDEDENWSIVI
jgi:hypothetical protein